MFVVGVERCAVRHGQQAFAVRRGGVAQNGLIDADTHAQVSRLWWFGRLIANTDMHDGNLAFKPGLKLAPVYDMLPMGYAPVRGMELPLRGFAPAHARRARGVAASGQGRLAFLDPRQPR